MKKIFAIVLLMVMVATVFTGCGNNETSSTGDNGKDFENKNRVLYNCDLSDYVNLGKYKGIDVDTSSEKYEEIYDELITADINNNNFFTMSDAITKGKVENGDTANIDYVGKKDGVAFSGGTASGHDLEIGSGSFIPGFEEGLVGVEIGSTVDLDLTFPENYHSADLAGAKVVFTVKVNSVKKKNVKDPEEFYSELGFESVDAYTNDVETRATEEFIIDTITADSKVKKYPDADITTIYKEYEKLIITNLTSQYNMDFPTYLTQIGMSEKEFKDTLINDEIKPLMESQMLMYAIFDDAKLSFKQKDIDKMINTELEAMGNATVTKEQLLEYYGDYYFEAAVVVEKATEYIVKNANIHN